MDWMIMPLKRYADFSGRSRRLEYWMFMLFLLLAFLGGFAVALAAGLFEPNALDSKAGEMSDSGVIVVLVLIVLYLAVLIPILAVQVRRFHDQDMSGWFVLLQFIPYVGGLIMFVFMCIDGTAGPNRFGPDPQGRGDAHVDIFA